jgi:hypothetical protein
MTITLSTCFGRFRIRRRSEQPLHNLHFPSGAEGAIHQQNAWVFTEAEGIMAQDTRNSSKRSDPKRRKNAAEYRAAHRRHSAAAADRKREAGLIRLSVWVPSSAENSLKQFAKCLCKGHVPDDIGGTQAEDGKITVIGGTPTRRTKQRCDERQLDLFDPA